MKLFIPTAITTYELTHGAKPFEVHHKFRRSIQAVNDEIVKVYGKPHLVVRWSPLMVAIKRFLRGAK